MFIVMKFKDNRNLPTNAISMKAIFQKIAESEFVFWIVIIFAVLGFLYLRNGAEYFSGDSGGAYWDNMTYCKSHPTGQMKIYSKLVSCEQIRAYRRYCSKNPDESISVDGTQIPCDRFLGKEDDHSPYDAY